MGLIKHTEAAAILKINEKRLRERDRAGNWMNYPELGRCQEVKGGPIWMLSEQVEEYMRRREEKIKSVILKHAKYSPPPKSSVDEAMARGWYKTAKILREMGAG